MKVKELRIILTVDNLDEIIQFYRDVAGFQVSKEWRDEATGNGIILEAGRASLELIDKKDAASIDEIEVGKRIAGPVRLALNIGGNIEEPRENSSQAVPLRWQKLNRRPGVKYNVCRIRPACSSRCLKPLLCLKMKMDLNNNYVRFYR